MKKLFTIILLMVGLVACSRTPMPVENPYTEIVCTKTDTLFVNDTTLITITNIDTVVYTDTTFVIIEDTNKIVVIIFNQINVDIRVDKGNDRLQYLDFVKFTVPYSGNYEIKVNAEYSEQPSEQMNESFYITVGGEGPLDPNTGMFRTVPDLNSSTNKVLEERYCGTWYIVEGITYKISLFHYYLIADLYPEYFNGGSWSVDSVHLKSLIIRKVR